MTDLETVNARAAIEYLVYRGRSEDDATWYCVIILEDSVSQSFGSTESPSPSILHCQGKLQQCPPCWYSTLLLTSSHRTIGYWERWKHAYIVTNGPWCGCTVLQVRPQNMSVLLGVINGRALIFCTPAATHWFHIGKTVIGFRPVRRAISKSDNPHFRLATTLSLSNSTLTGKHFVFHQQDNFQQDIVSNADFTKRFPNQKSTTQLFLLFSASYVVSPTCVT